jgi:hypothetical protein
VEDIEVELEKNVNIKFTDNMKFVSSEFGITRNVPLNYVFKANKFVETKQQETNEQETKEQETVESETKKETPGKKESEPTEDKKENKENKEDKEEAKKE